MDYEREKERERVYDEIFCDDDDHYLYGESGSGNYVHIQDVMVIASLITVVLFVVVLICVGYYHMNEKGNRRCELR